MLVRSPDAGWNPFPIGVTNKLNSVYVSPAGEAWIALANHERTPATGAALQSHSLVFDSIRWSPDVSPKTPAVSFRELPKARGHAVPCEGRTYVVAAARYTPTECSHYMQHAGDRLPTRL